MTTLYIALILILVVRAFWFYKPNSKQENISNVSVDQLNHLMKKDKAVLIDVRSQRETIQGTIGDPLQIELGPTMIKKMVNLDKKKKYILYCRSGRRSLLAGKEMLKLGFKDVNNLEGGYLAWARNN